MKSYVLSAIGLVLVLLSFTLLSVDIISFIIPLILGLVYLLFGLGIIHTSQKILLVLVSTSLLLVTILAYLLDLHIHNLVWSVVDPITGSSMVTVGRSFWFNDGGVCTEGTSCWLSGQFIPPIVSVAFLLYGLIRTIKSKIG